MATLIKQKPKLFNKNIFKLESVLDTNIIFYLISGGDGDRIQKFEIHLSHLPKILGL